MPPRQRPTPRAATRRDTEPVAELPDTIRSSVDLTAARHHALRVRENELMQTLGAVRGIRKYLLAAMVAAYLTDETVARRVNALLPDELDQP